MVRQEQNKNKKNLFFFFFLNTTCEALLWFTIKTSIISFSKELLFLNFGSIKATSKLRVLCFGISLEGFTRTTAEPWPGSTGVRPLTPSEYQTHRDEEHQIHWSPVRLSRNLIFRLEIRPEIADEGANRAAVVSPSGQRGSCVEAERSLSWPAVGHDLRCRRRRLNTTTGSGGDSRAKAAAVAVERRGEREGQRVMEREKTDDDADAELW